MNTFFKVLLDTPWKVTNELLMLLIKPFVYIYLKLSGVKIGTGFKFYGFPRIYRHRNSQIIIGNNFEARSWWFSNPLGINHPLILCTWQENAKIEIGNDVGISGGSLVASKEIKIGDRVLIGANTTIIDTDFHPLKGEDKRYSKENIKSFPVIIEDDSFIGINSTILKGVTIKKGVNIAAGEVVRHEQS